MAATERPNISTAQRLVAQVVLALVILTGALAGWLTVHLVQAERQALATARANARRGSAEQAAAIDTRLRAVIPGATAIAHDLGAGTLLDKDIKARLQSAVDAAPDVLDIGVAYRPFAKSPQERLFAPHVSASGGAYQLEERYDYTEYPWFKDGLSGPAAWGEPYFDDDAKAIVACYTVPFARAGSADPTPIGIVRVTISLAPIRQLVSAETLGQTGYGFLLSRKGIYLADPVEDYVRRQRSVFDVADERHDPARRRLAEKALAGQRAEEVGTSAVTGQTTLMFTEPIPISGWSLGSMFIRDEVTLSPREVRRGLIKIETASMAFVFCLAVTAYFWRAIQESDVWRLVAVASVLLISGICFIWWLTLHFPDRTDESSVHVVDEANLGKFVTEHRLLPDVDPIQIPTGVYIRTIRFGSANDFVISGDVWQRFQPALVGLVTEGVDLPDAESVDLKEAYRRKTPDGTTTVGWALKTAIRESSSGSSQYPFDRTVVRLRLSPRDFDRNVVLTPDLSGYQLLIPSALPGLDHLLVVPGWRMTQTYFSFTQTNYATSFGVGNSLSRARAYELTFNMIAQRQFLDPFISSVLPILVIACLLFGLLIIGSKKPTKVAATGFKATDILRAGVTLMFPALVAQVNLRSRIGASDIIYIEYFYFVLYTSIIGVAANSLLFTMGGRGIMQLHDNLIPKILYWPSVLGACFVVTLFFLY